MVGMLLFISYVFFATAVIIYFITRKEDVKSIRTSYTNEVMRAFDRQVMYHGEVREMRTGNVATFRVQGRQPSERSEPSEQSESMEQVSSQKSNRDLIVGDIVVLLDNPYYYSSIQVGIEYIVRSIEDNYIEIVGLVFRKDYTGTGHNLDWKMTFRFKQQIYLGGE